MNTDEADNPLSVIVRGFRNASNLWHETHMLYPFYLCSSVFRLNRSAAKSRV